MLISHLSDIASADSNETCTVFLISPGYVRRRKLAAKNTKISVFHQGPSTERGSFKKGEIYPGNAKIKSNNDITVQILHLNLDSGAGTLTVYKYIPVVAIWVPKRLELQKWIEV